MGLFSSKTKTYVGVQFTRMMEDSEIVGVHQAALLDYTLGSNKRVDALATTFNDVYQQHLNGCIGSKMLERIAWARKKYAYGVPEGKQYKEDAINLPAIFKDYMLAQGRIVNIDYIKFGPINNQHAVYQKLMDLMDYDPTTNIVHGAGNGFTTYLHDFKIHYCTATITNTINPSYLNPMGYPATHGQTAARSRNELREHTAWVEDSEAENDFAEVTLTYRNAAQQDVYYKIQLDFLDYEYSNAFMDEEGHETPEDAVLDQAYYMVRYREDNKLKYFTYAYGSGLIAYLDNAIASDVDPGKYMPQIYLTLERSKMNADKSTEGYKTSKTYCNFFNLNYDTLIDDTWDEIAAKSRDVKSIFITNRLPVNTQDPATKKYVYHFFNEMFKNAGSVPVRSDYLEERKDQIATQQVSGMSLVVADKLHHYTVSYTGISSIAKKGKVADIGEVTSNIFKSGFAYIHKIQMQLSETTYREIEVRGLKVNQKVAGNKGDTFAGSDGELMLPVDVEIIRKLMPTYKHELMCKSLYIVVTTLKKVKQKWYQTGIFKVLTFIVAVVISYFTGGAGMVWYMALAKAVLVTVVSTVAVQMISRLLVAIGLDAGLVLAVVAVIAIAVGVYAHVKETTVAGLNAKDFMALANHSFAISNNSFQLQLQAKFKAFLDFQDMHTERMEELEKLRKELGLEDTIQLDIFTLLSDNITRPDIRLGESPISFLERTTTVDAGKLPVAVVNNFVFLTTTLPTFESLMQKRYA